MIGDIRIEVLIAVVLVIVVLAAALRIAQEHERFAVFALGRFVGLKGPGLLLKPPGSAYRWIRVRLAQQGAFLGDGLAQFGGASMPVRLEANAAASQSVRIHSFRGGEVWVTPLAGTSRLARCEQCGHEMTVY